MKLSISNIAWEQQNDNLIYDAMRQYGFLGLEIAPTRWIGEQPYAQIEKAKTMAQNLKEQYGYTVSSMQSIWFGRVEQIFASEEDRNALCSYTKEAIDFASAIGCNNLVFGCPKSRNIQPEWGLLKEQTEEIAVNFFKELGDYAYEKGTVIGMEANPVLYNTNFVNTTEEALELIEKVNSKGFLLNLDVGTMLYNKEDVTMLTGKVSLINHVHISEPGLKLIEKRAMHQQLAKILKQEQYEKFVSIEVGKQEDAAQLKTVMQYVMEVFCD